MGSVRKVAVVLAMLAATGVVAQREEGKMMVSFARKLNTEFKEQNDPVCARTILATLSLRR